MSQKAHLSRNYNFYCLFSLEKNMSNSARLGWWEGRDSASSSSFVLCLWIRRTERVLGGTQAKEATEHFCLGTSVLGATSCYKIAFAAHWELLAAKKPLTCLTVLPGVCFCREGVTVQRKLACTLSATETCSVERSSGEGFLVLRFSTFLLPSHVSSFL